MVIWLIGLSGSGKSTIGRHLVNHWQKIEKNTVIVDGDEVREIFKNDADYSVDGRRLNNHRIVRICQWLDSQQINVVCCILSIFPEQQNQNRTLFSNYFEAYIKVPMIELEKRDQKNLYSRAKTGQEKNVVGIDLEFVEPKNADIVIQNFGIDANPKTFALDIFNTAKRLS